VGNIREFIPKKKTGFWHEVGIPARGVKLYDALNRGLPFKVYCDIARVTGLEKADVARATVIAKATLQRRAKLGRFTKEESDRLYRLSEVFNAVVDLFENDRKAAKQWLNNPIKGLGNKRPIEMLSTGAEAEAVLNLIGRLEHGVFS